MPTKIPPEARRILILISKILQNISNGTKAKEKSVQFTNPYIEQSMPEFKTFIDKLANWGAPQVPPPPPPLLVEPTVNMKDVLVIHKFLQSELQSIRRWVDEEIMSGTRLKGDGVEEDTSNKSEVERKNNSGLPPALTSPTGGKPMLNKSNQLANVSKMNVTDAPSASPALTTKSGRRGTLLGSQMPYRQSAGTSSICFWIHIYFFTERGGSGRCR